LTVLYVPCSLGRDNAEALRALMKQHGSVAWDARALDKELNPDVSLALPGGKP